AGPAGGHRVVDDVFGAAGRRTACTVGAGRLTARWSAPCSRSITPIFIQPAGSSHPSGALTGHGAQGRRLSYTLRAAAPMAPRPAPGHDHEELGSPPARPEPRLAAPGV